MNIQIFTDGGSRGNPGQAAVGVVSYHDGVEICTLSQAIGVATNNEAEYAAILASLDWLQEFSQKNAIESVSWYLDSKLVVEQLSRRWKIKEPRMQQLAAKAWEHLQALSITHSFSHIPREKNAVADGLVNTALDAQAAK